jgi:LemA protein
MTLLVIVGVIAVLLLLTYNGLVSKRVACENSWSQIDIQLKRRHDLIPNLVETVKGYASHERQTLEAVIAARNAAAAPASGNFKDQVQAEQNLSGTLRQLFAISENYPQLKANENFMKLHEELSSTENRIGFARQNYNDSVAVYNSARQQVPGNIVVGFGNFPAKEFFELDPSEAQTVKEVPKVSF